jgi:hypothetical protein
MEDQMSQKLFAAASQALWGPHYQSEAARQLGIGLRSVTRYDAGERSVPPVLLVRLGKMLEQRQDEIARLRVKMPSTA